MQILTVKNQNFLKPSKNPSIRTKMKIFKSAETVNVKFGVYGFGDKGQ